jgi:His Kinase A (phospho-acceptor) domain
MSHELRTPLNAILGYSELVLDSIYGDMPQQMRGVLERVNSNGKHLLRLINDVLDLTATPYGTPDLTELRNLMRKPNWSLMLSLNEDPYFGRFSDSYLEAMTKAESRPESASLHRIRVPFTRPALFEERLAEVRNGCGEQFRLFLLWSEENKVDEAFGDIRRQFHNIDLLLPLYVLLNQVIDFAVQATLR